MRKNVVRELEVYKMLARLGIELGAGVVARYGLMSAAVPLTLEAPGCGAARAADEEIGFDPVLRGALAALSRKH
jgi:hypothetical protein